MRGQRNGSDSALSIHMEANGASKGNHLKRKTNHPSIPEQLRINKGLYDDNKKERPRR